MSVKKNISEIIKIKTYFRLGFFNILRVAIYRIALRVGLHPVQFIKSSIISAPFFRTCSRGGEILPEIKNWDNTTYSILKDSPQPQRSVSFGLLNTNEDESSSFL